MTRCGCTTKERHHVRIPLYYIVDNSTQIPYAQNSVVDALTCKTSRYLDSTQLQSRLHQKQIDDHGTLFVHMMNSTVANLSTVFHIMMQIYLLCRQHRYNYTATLSLSICSSNFFFLVISVGYTPSYTVFKQYIVQNL